MGLSAWLGGDMAAMAKRIAGDLANSLPREVEAATTLRSRAIRKKAVESTLRSVTQLCQGRPMNIFQRIVFARTFQKELVAASYSPEFVRQITTALMAEITLPDNQRRGTT